MLADVKRQHIVVLVSLAVVLLVGSVLLGSFGGSDSKPEPISGAPKEVANVVARLELVTRRKEFAVLCDELFTRSARTRAGGGDCVELLRSTAKDVRRARIRLLDVQIAGDRARAKVRTTAEGQTAVEETLELERERGRYRISALAG